MKKVLVLILGIVFFYALLLIWYRPNFILNGRLQRGSKDWKFSNSQVKIIDEKDEPFPYFEIAPKGILEQTFRYPLLFGTYYDLTLEAKANDSSAKLIFNLGENTYCILSVTNDFWRQFYFRIPIYKTEKGPVLKFISNGRSKVLLRDLTFRRAPVSSELSYKEISGSFVQNLVKNGDFTHATNDWELSNPDLIAMTNYDGLPTLMIKQTPKTLGVVSQKIKLKKNQRYFLSSHQLIDDKRSAPKIARVIVKYSDSKEREFILDYKNPPRLTWCLGTGTFTPDQDCEATLSLDCQVSKEKAPGRVFFHGVSLLPVD